MKNVASLTLFKYNLMMILDSNLLLGHHVHGTLVQVNAVLLLPHPTYVDGLDLRIFA